MTGTIEREPLHLSEDDRIRLAAQVDHFVMVLASRYDVTPQEVVETVQWVRRHREYLERLKTAGVISIIGISMSAALLALWEGARGLLRKG